MPCALWGFQRAEQYSSLLQTIVLYKRVMTAFDLFLNVPRTHDAIFWHCLPWCWSGLFTGNQESRSLQGLWQNLMGAGLFHLRFHSILLRQRDSSLDTPWVLKMEQHYLLTQLVEGFSAILYYLCLTIVLSTSIRLLNVNSSQASCITVHIVGVTGQCTHPCSTPNSRQ
jgi:hypothetical protein